VYVAPSGREYDVRNPNFSPFYSIRFKSASDSIATGESDIFEYTLPPSANPAYIHVISRVQPKVFYEAHLNTFNCTVAQSANSGHAKQSYKGQHLSLFPNPTSGELYADLSGWLGQQVQLSVFDSRGQRVHHIAVQADAAPQPVELPQHLSDGLYFLELAAEGGDKHALRFILQRQ
jgi:hypothetical protein